MCIRAIKARVSGAGMSLRAEKQNPFSMVSLCAHAKACMVCCARALTICRYLNTFDDVPYITTSVNFFNSYYIIYVLDCSAWLEIYTYGLAEITCSVALTHIHRI